MTDDDYHVYLMPFPGDIRAAVRIDSDGYPSIYINDKLAPEAAKRALLHELKHIQHDDFGNGLTLREIEKNATASQTKIEKAC